jgi:hypothetical protein
MDAIGLDVAKTRFDVCERKLDSRRTVQSDERGRDALTGRPGRRALVVMQASGGLERRLQGRFAHRGLEAAGRRAEPDRIPHCGELARRRPGLDAEPERAFGLLAPRREDRSRPRRRIANRVGLAPLANASGLRHSEP